MRKARIAFVALIGVAALTPMTAGAVPVEFTDNGHHYEVIIAPGISWNAAKAAAEGMMITVDGVDYQGHLAIITSAGEDGFIETLRSQAALASPEVWVGAFQDPATADPAANWQWIIPEAPFDNFTNWQLTEPNDFNGIDEKFLGIGHGGPGWNDEHATGNIGGYVVEFDVNAFVFKSADIPQCLESGGTGCPVTINGAQILTIPDAAVMQDPQLAATTFILTDNPARCGVAPLVLFGGDLIISPNHCATPETGYRFAVVHTEADGIELQEGTVRVVQDAKALLPTFPYSCDDPIVSGSPNDQEIVIYQRDNKEDMREFGFTWGAFMDDGSGATADITDSCGTSRARRAENSYSVVGMVQRFEPGAEFGTDPALNFQRWNELVLFKLDRLVDAVMASSPALSRRQFNQILTQAQRARQKFAEADYSRASSHLRNLLRKVEIASYSNVTGNNDQGEAIERAGSIKFMIETKVEPFESGA